MNEYAEKDPNYTTRTALLQGRRKEKVPHISYDLDGDGVVGNRDLVIAKRFDLDKDNRLNTAERTAAVKALEEGYENNFIWGLESSGPSANRVMQKRGEIVQGEDFTNVKKTYPQHYLETQDVKYSSIKDVNKARMISDAQSLAKCKERYDELNPPYTEVPKYQNEYYTTN